MVLPPSISLAMSNGDLSIVYHYLETRQEGTSIDEPDADGSSLLLRTSLESFRPGRLELMQYLIVRGADVNFADPDQSATTPL